MLHVLYGPDTYRSREKLNEMIAEYQSSDSNRRADVHVIDAEEDDVSRIKQLAEAGSLFSKRKLIVVKYSLSSGNGFEELALIAKRARTDADTLVIAWDPDLGKEGTKRLAELKLSKGEVGEFQPLAPAELRKWIAAEAKKREITISSADIGYLVSLGSDLWMIANELEKLAVQPQPEKHKVMSGAVSIFEFGDLFMAAPRRALVALPKILASGQEEFPLYSYLAGYCRTLLIIHAYVQRREPIPGQYKIAPFVATKGKALVQKIPVSELRAMLQNFFIEDYKIKTGSSTIPDSLARILLVRQQAR
ncbi:MAG: hypothetical protein HY617_00765 [Candidatus Sungbacteria bacterium]|nr:hypothetical protein [Candidatus Sungbacteria bacterium]